MRTMLFILLLQGISRLFSKRKKTTAVSENTEQKGSLRITALEYIVPIAIEFLIRRFGRQDTRKTIARI